MHIAICLFFDYISPYNQKDKGEQMLKDCPHCASHLCVELKKPSPERNTKLLTWITQQAQRHRISQSTLSKRSGLSRSRLSIYFKWSQARPETNPTITLDSFLRLVTAINEDLIVSFSRRPIQQIKCPLTGQDCPPGEHPDSLY